MLKHKPKDTPVAIVRNAGRETEEHEITTLEKMLDSEINMLTIVLIGNSNTFVKKGKMVTPRGYDKKIWILILFKKSKQNLIIYSNLFKIKLLEII